MTTEISHVIMDQDGVWRNHPEPKIQRIVLREGSVKIPSVLPGSICEMEIIDSNGVTHINFLKDPESWHNEKVQMRIESDAGSGVILDGWSIGKGGVSVVVCPLQHFLDFDNAGVRITRKRNLPFF